MPKGSALLGTKWELFVASCLTKLQHFSTGTDRLELIAPTTQTFTCTKINPKGFKIRMSALRQSLQSDKLFLMEATDHSSLAKIRAFSHMKAQREMKETNF